MEATRHVSYGPNFTLQAVKLPLKVVSRLECRDLLTVACPKNKCPTTRPTPREDPQRGVLDSNQRNACEVNADEARDRVLVHRIDRSVRARSTGCVKKLGTTSAAATSRTLVQRARCARPRAR